MGSNQILKIDNAKNEFKLIPIENSIRIIPEKGTPFTITNNGSNSISIIVKRTNMNNLFVSIEKWFGENKIPNNVNKLDNIFDYFIDIRFVKTEAPIQEKIFSSEKELYDFLVMQDLYSVTYTGAAIHNFVSNEGLNYSIVDIINKNNANVVHDGIYLQFC